MYTVLFCVLLVTGVRGDFSKDGEGDDQLLTPAQKRAMRTRSANITFPAWTNAKIPYILDPGFQSSAIHMTALQNAVNILKEKTCIQVVPRTTEQYYVKFLNSGPNGGCSSFMGMLGPDRPVQDINIADWCTGDRWYSTVHEIVHCLGFVHEQCRTDRDTYVNVNMSNPAATNINYQKMPESAAKTFTSYDYDSVMHYPATVGLLEPKDPNVSIGQRDHLSPCDIAKINKYYNCPTTFQQTACPMDVTPAGPTTSPPTTTKPTTTKPTTAKPAATTTDFYYYYYYYVWGST